MHPTDYAASDMPAILIALELSKEAWLVASRTGNGPVRHKRLKGGDADGLERLIAAERRRLGDRHAAVSVCYEVGYDGFWLHRRLARGGIDCVVIDPTSLKIDRRAKHRKTDRIDVVSILNALAGLKMGLPDACRPVRVPSVREEDAKRLGRERNRLHKERNAHSNRIKALLAVHGVRGFHPNRGYKADRLAALRTGDGRPLPPRLVAELTREIARLNLVREQIWTVEGERDALLSDHPEATNDPVVREDRTPERMLQAARQLRSLHSIGAEAATVLAREAFHRDFRNRREVASYAGLTPTPYASGSVQREQGIGKAGNPWIRRLMVELSWLWLRNQPDSALSKWYKARSGTGMGSRKVGAVALARKLLVALWRFVEFGVVPEGARLRGEPAPNASVAANG